MKVFILQLEDEYGVFDNDVVLLSPEQNDLKRLLDMYPGERDVDRGEFNESFADWCVRRGFAQRADWEET